MANNTRMKNQINVPAKTARFWTWYNDGWVKLTLYPDEIFSFGGGGPTDEGYSLEWYRYHYDGHFVYCEYVSRSRDCDGPHEYNAESRCHVEMLRYTMSDDGTLRPTWQRLKASQRDVYAEMAGY